MAKKKTTTGSGSKQRSVEESPGSAVAATKSSNRAKATAATRATPTRVRFINRTEVIYSTTGRGSFNRFTRIVGQERYSSTAMIIPSRIIYQAWFKPDVADQRYHHCICGKVYQQDVTISGYSNLLQHLKAAHKGYEAITNVKGTLQPAITELLQLGKSASLNKGANWIVMKALPLSFCEDPHTRVTAHAKGPHARDHEEGRACLDSVTGVHPKIKNETRWSSTMKMLKRWNDLIPALRQMSTKNAVKCGVDKLMLSATEAMELSKLVKDLTKLDSVTIALQDEELTMLQEFYNSSVG
ncbi:hypothetical protein PR002_g12287 [Phytophthora rubi]|uniref:BED-type domain-containing protein n=1 Tax=Phytophthora rubi TaxID=129364 RepID=A0A6A3LYG7_9STRA|nr:hypothetical protein PR002_g12287 [Phytophthora rubi]